MKDLIPQLQTLFVLYGIKVLGAIIILVVGRWIAKLISGTIRKVMQKRNIDETLVSFAASLVYFLLLAFVVIASIGCLGIPTASMAAAIAAAGLAVGFALQGSLANFAAGILLIVFRPFKVGDFVEASGSTGIVEEIDLFTTTLKTPDNKSVIIPNAKLTADNIVNYSAKDIRRVDLVVGVSYDDDLDKTREAIRSVLSKDGRILHEPEPTIGVLDLADSSVDFAVRPWVKTDDYWDVRFDTLESLKKRLDSEGITIPFPQSDIHVYRQEESTG